MLTYLHSQNVCSREKTTAFGNDTSSVKLVLFHPSSKLNIQTEFYVNDFNSLFGNVGGMVGLLIGASLLGFVDYILAFMQRNTKKLAKITSG